jgi:hypothetical protein
MKRHLAMRRVIFAEVTENVATLSLHKRESQRGFVQLIATVV